MPIKTHLASLCILTTFILGSTALADQVILDDLIVASSICAGTECVDGEVFDFDTLKLKGDDPQIGFVDTSSSASFPTNDWAMGITDNAGTGPAQFL